MSQKHELRQLHRILKKVHSFDDAMKSLSDAELCGLTEDFKRRLSEGQSLDDILPEAYSAMCEADYRILGMRPYDVQIIGAIGLHRGRMCEMNTGEGKTLVATMPLYLNALTGRGTILVTTNDYLASRDCKEMGPVYEFMGLTVACGAEDKESERQDNEIKKEIYSADIVYTTNGGLGFDYLFNNLVKDADDRFLRDFYYVIVDEADEVLLDSAQMPLVVSGAPRVQSNLYEMADFFITTLKEEEDYVEEDGAVWLTEKGIQRAESYFKIDNFYSAEYFEMNRHVNLALKAHMTMENGKNYVVTEKDELVLLDETTGRLMHGVKMRGGISQAMEVKEGLKPSQETRSIASVTYQNLFGLFEKIAGMSGTITNTREELRQIYGVETVVIPPNKPVIRNDMKDTFCVNSQEQIDRVVKLISATHELGQPVLVVAASIKDTLKISDFLIKEKIPHNVLNANNAYWEANIISEAGQKGAVTVATTMAGRGTDIKLGEGVREIGGLMVIGVGRMGNARLERQARGRAGRQGDPGISKFFVSLEDDVVEGYGSEELEKYVEGRRRIGKSKLRKIINGSQKLSEEMSASGRIKATDYDKVMKKQRELIYRTRNKLLDGGSMSDERFMEIAQDVVNDFLDGSKNYSSDLVNRFILDNISYHSNRVIDNMYLRKKKILRGYLMDIVTDMLRKKRRSLGGEKQFREFVRIATLTAIDEEWVEEVDYLQQLQSAVGGRSTSQRNPVYEYQNDALEAYSIMAKKVYRNILRNVLLSSVNLDDKGKFTIVFP